MCLPCPLAQERKPSQHLISTSKPVPCRMSCRMMEDASPYPTPHRPMQEREPFQYLIATQHWRSHVLAVGPGVLVPRPETEAFYDLVTEALAKRPPLARLPWADLGTGSGAVAIAAAEALVQHDKVGDADLVVIMTLNLWWLSGVSLITA